MGTAKNDGIKITKKQAKKVLQLCDSEHDAVVGVNWDVISCHIDRVVGE